MADIHQFKLGDFNCHIINDGNITMGPTWIFFEGASTEDLKQALAEHNLNARSMTIPCSCLLVDTGEHKILVDCGSAGETRSYDADLGYLFEGLESIAVQTDDITHVILSHGHFDHIAAIADDTDTPRFKNASYVMAQGEWDYWIDDYGKSEDDATMLAKLLGIEGQLSLVEPDTSILDGVNLLHTPGHTLHHLSVEFESGEDTLLCLIDTMDHPLQGQHSTWGANWDIDSKQSVQSRQRMLKRAVEKNALVHGFHFPFPGLGKFTFDGEVWQWETQS